MRQCQRGARLEQLQAEASLCPDGFDGGVKRGNPRVPIYILAREVRFKKLVVVAMALSIT